MTDVVLVHGAFHGGWCWRDCAQRLRALGHTVFTPTLTGLGERSHLIGAGVTLDTHIQDIVGVFEAEELSDAVLVGHSYGGMPITGAADALAERIRGIVFLDAFVPTDGKSARAIRDAVPGAIPLAVQDGQSEVAPHPVEAFGLTGELAAWVSRRMTPHPLATMTQPIRLTGAWQAIRRKVYVRAALYPAPYFDACYDAVANDPAWVAIREELPHNHMMADPDWFTDILQRHALGE